MFSCFHLGQPVQLSIKYDDDFPKRQILDSSKLKEFADENFKFDKNGRKCSKWIENNVGKGEIALYDQFLLFPQWVFFFFFFLTCAADM